MKTAAQRLTFSKRGRPRNVKTEHLTTTRQKAVAEHEVWCLWQGSAQWGTPATLDSLHSSSTQCLTGFWPGTQGPQRMGSAGTVAQVSLQISDLIQHSMALELLLFQIVVRFPSLNSGANLTSTWERHDWFVVNKLALPVVGTEDGCWSLNEVCSLIQMWLYSARYGNRDAFPAYTPQRLWKAISSLSFPTSIKSSKLSSNTQ